MTPQIILHSDQTGRVGQGLKDVFIYLRGETVACLIDLVDRRNYSREAANQGRGKIKGTKKGPLIRTT